MHEIFNDGEVFGMMITVGLIAFAILSPNIIHLGRIVWKELVDK
jgi:hypothetical protein